MKKQVKDAVKNILKSFDVGVTRHSRLLKLEQHNSAAQDLEILLQLPEETALQRMKYLKRSQSQLRQDLFVLSHFNFKRNGFFVEFGAANGVGLSNSYLMEKDFGWNGILAEPARIWHEELKNNRSCIIETACVWKETGATLTFNEAAVAEMSTIRGVRDPDRPEAALKTVATYDVKTISLDDLLAKYDAPKSIEYLSIDTEGSEYEILKNFDFSKRSFEVITCEHNFTPAREEIFGLLSRHGYRRVFQELSHFDDWYVK